MNPSNPAVSVKRFTLCRDLPGRPIIKKDRTQDPAPEKGALKIKGLQRGHVFSDHVYNDVLEVDRFSNRRDDLLDEVIGFKFGEDGVPTS
jgi:hypothetical protein